jgi:hypothetical protein
MTTHALFDRFTALKVCADAGARAGRVASAAAAGVVVLRLRDSGGLFVGQLGTNGRASGIGSLQLSDMSSASGEWVDGELSGLVQLVWPGGNSFLGVVENGVPSGYGELRLGEDNVLLGEFCAGLCEGFGIHTHGGVVRKHFFSRGRMSGPGADLREEEDGTELIVRVGHFVEGLLVREAADSRETEALLEGLFRAEQRLFAEFSKPLAQKWTSIAKELDAVEAQMVAKIQRKGIAAPVDNAARSLAAPADDDSSRPRRQRSIGDGRRYDSASLRAVAQQVLQETPPSSPQIGAAARVDFRTARGDDLSAAAAAEVAAGESPSGERRKLRGAKKPSYSELTSGSPKRTRPTSRGSAVVPPLAVLPPAPPADGLEQMTPRRFATMLAASVVTVQLAKDLILPGELVAGAVHIDVAKGAVLEECKIAFVARSERTEPGGSRSSTRLFRVRKTLVREHALRHGIHSLPFSFTTRSDTPPSGVPSAAASRAQTLRGSGAVADADDGPVRLSRNTVSKSLRRVVASHQTVTYSVDVTLTFARRPQVFHRQRVVIGEPPLQSTTSLQALSTPALHELLGTLDADLERECRECEQRYDEQIDLLLEAMMVHEVFLLTQPYDHALALTRFELARRTR